MDGSEAMAMSGPASQFYIQYRSIGNGIVPGSPPPPQQPLAGLHGPPGIRPMTNPITGHPVQCSHAGGSAFQAESHLPQGASAGGQAGEPVKRKRGKPRKYGPDGTMSLALSPVSSTHPGTESGEGAVASGSGSATPVQKRGRGRPPGTGTKQQLASLGEWIAGSAGTGFTPHIITIAEGEDITRRIMSFSQQGPRNVCILSAYGSVSKVTLQQSTTSAGTVTYEGCFEILCMSGSYLLTDDGVSRTRSGGLNISLSGPDGRVIGGGVGGLLLAASPVQVIVGSFIYGGSKVKNKTKSTQEAGESEPPVGGKPSTPTSMIPSQNHTLPPVTGGWPGLGQIDMRNSHLDIDPKRE